MAITGIQKFTNSLSEKLKEEIRTPLLKGEQIIDSQSCNRAISGAALGGSIGGTLFITNQRVIFETAKLQTKIKNITDIIILSDIVEVKKGDNVGIGNLIPVGGLNKDKAVIVQAADNTYVFVPQDPDKCIEKIVSANSSISIGEKANSIESLKASTTGKSMEGNSLLDKAFKAANSVASASKEILSKGVDASKAAKADSDGNKISPDGPINDTAKQSVTAATAAPAVDPIEQIKKFKELFDMGIISEEEFSAKKKELLGL